MDAAGAVEEGRGPGRPERRITIADLFGGRMGLWAEPALPAAEPREPFGALLEAGQGASLGEGPRREAWG